MWLHIGANMDQRERVFIGTMTARRLGVRNVGNKQIITLSTPDGANRSIGALDAASRWSTSSAPTSAPTRTGSSTR